MTRYLLAHDFDQTTAITFDSSWAGGGSKLLGVNEAIEYTVGDIFGKEGLSLYKSLGGNKNKAPSELIHALLATDSSSLFLHRVSEYWAKHQESLLEMVPVGKGSLPLKDGTMSETDATEVFVRRKLQYLSDQIGTPLPDGQIWPPPGNGFLDYWQTIQTLKQRGVPLDTAIISAGHELFIRNTFSTWGVPAPDILVTDDDVRSIQYIFSQEWKVKPGLVPLALAHHQWLDIQKEIDSLSPATSQNTRDTMIYFGDDKVRDGGMAANGKISFGLYKEGNPYHVDNDTNTIVFGNWKNIADILLAHEANLHRGESFHDIFISEESSLGERGRLWQERR